MNTQSSITNNALTTIVGIKALKVGQLYKVNRIPSTNEYITRSEMETIQKMKKKYYTFAFVQFDSIYVFQEYPNNTKTARDPNKEVWINKDIWKHMTFIDRSLVRERAKEFYTIRKIYEESLNQSGQLGTGPLDLIREMLGKV